MATITASNAAYSSCVVKSGSAVTATICGDQRDRQRAGQQAERGAAAAGQRHAAEQRRHRGEDERLQPRIRVGRRVAVAEQGAAERGQRSGQGEGPDDPAVNADPGHTAGPPVTADRAQLTPQLGEAQYHGRDEEHRDRQQAAWRENPGERLVDPQGRVAVGVRLAQATGHRVRETEQSDVGGERDRHGRDAQARDEPALERPDGGARGDSGQHAERRRRSAGLDGEHAAQCVRADDRQVELAGDHGDPDREGKQAELSEALQRVVHVE